MFVQGSLLASGPAGSVPAADPSFPRLERRSLSEASWFDFAPGWLSGADDVFDWLVDESGWKHRQRPMYGELKDEPRLTTTWGLGRRLDRLDRVVADMARLLGRRYHTTFDGVWCNWYRDGRDSVAWHSDREGRSQRHPLVAIVSVGEPRAFLLRPKGGGPSIRYRLGGGDLAVMGGDCQHEWEHCVPKVAHAGPRISITLRHRTCGACPTCVAGSIRPV